MGNNKWREQNRNPADVAMGEKKGEGRGGSEEVLGYFESGNVD